MGGAHVIAAIAGGAAALIALAAMVVFGACSSVQRRLEGCFGFGDYRSEEGQALVSHEERTISGADATGDDTRASRKAVDEAFRSVERLEASLKRGHDR